MAAKKPLYVHFTFGIELLGVAYSNDTVPPGKDPVEYLRERVLAELDRVTLAAQSGAAAPTVVLPGYDRSNPVGFEQES